MKYERFHQPNLLKKNHIIKPIPGTNKFLQSQKNHIDFMRLGENKFQLTKMQEILLTTNAIILLTMRQNPYSPVIDQLHCFVTVCMFC